MTWRKSRVSPPLASRTASTSRARPGTNRSWPTRSSGPLGTSRMPVASTTITPGRPLGEAAVPVEHVVRDEAVVGRAPGHHRGHPRPRGRDDVGAEPDGREPPRARRLLRRGPPGLEQGMARARGGSGVGRHGPTLPVGATRPRREPPVEPPGRAPVDCRAHPGRRDARMTNETPKPPAPPHGHPFEWARRAGRRDADAVAPRGPERAHVRGVRRAREEAARPARRRRRSRRSC